MEKKNQPPIICKNKEQFLECQKILIKEGFYLGFAPKEDCAYYPQYVDALGDGGKNSVLISKTDSIEYCSKCFYCEWCEEKCFQSGISSENFINNYRTKKIGRILDESEE